MSEQPPVDPDLPDGSDGSDVDRIARLGAQAGHPFPTSEPASEPAAVETPASEPAAVETPASDPAAVESPAVEAPVVEPPAAETVAMPLPPAPPVPPAGPVPAETVAMPVPAASPAGPVPAQTPSAVEPAPAEPAPGRVATRAVAAVVVLAVLAAVTVALAGLVASRVSSANADEGSRGDVVGAATSGVASVLSYDYRHLDSDFARAEGLLTPKFRKQYDDTTAKGVRPLAAKYKAISSADVSAAGVVEAARDRAVVLVFVNQTVTNSQLTAPRLDRSRIKVTLVRSNGRWLIDKLTTL